MSISNFNIKLYKMRGGYMEKKDYYIGLDMGTSSVGWAVTDEQYHLMRAKGKDMWGVRLFSEAKTAADRRSHRTARRNLNRRNARIGFLKEIFEEDILKVDPGFYERLRESKYHLEDKSSGSPFVLFADSGYTDKEYYNDYPTVFHLINELASDEGKKPHDVRLVFLACLNIFKHRGHFLNDNLAGDGVEDINELCKDFIERLGDYYQNNDLDENTEVIQFDSSVMADCFKEVLCNKHLSNSSKKKELLSKLGIGNKNKAVVEMVALTCGLTATVSKIFPKEVDDEEQKKQTLSFKSTKLDEDLPKIEIMLTAEEYEIICLLKKIHDWSVVSVIMGDHTSISEARVESYEKHQNDLKKLKYLYKTYAKDCYDSMFRDMSDNNYSAYVGKTSSDKVSKSRNHKTRMQRRGAKCSQEELYKKIKKDLEKAPASAMEEILLDMDTNSFLPKQLTNENGVIPYQLHKAELVKILDNASNYLDFLNVKDDDGLSNKDKIIRLFEFRIPYYVGPLYKDESKDTNAWVVRKGEGKVYPWNFDEMIDKKASAEVFIERMVRHCTYLNDESALPKNSLKYERFRVLNELNNLCINGERVSPEIKQRIYNELFKKSKKRISKSKLCSYLYSNGLADKDVEVSGFDGTFANALFSYGKFCEVFDVETLTDKQEEIAENIIMWSTVYGDSKKFLREKINECYGPESDNQILNNKQINRVIGYKFTEWGKLSKSFLNLRGADNDTGEILPLITRMWEENYNLMELLSNRFTYREEVEKKTSALEKTLYDIEYDDLEDLYISAPVKRMTWQTLLILKEIYQVMGYAPKKVFVEMARDEEEKRNGVGQRKSSRKKRLEELYKNCKVDSDDMAKSLKDCDEAKLRSKKLYLYYMQKGRCMYSGKVINIESLFTNDYDIDHIYPQSVIKDDSLDNNMVLVERNYNNKKSDNYPIFSDWQNKMKGFWDILRDEGFLNDEKYRRLTRTEEFSDNELADFVNRQLVETRQATKTVAELIKNSLFDREGKSSRVVYVKARNVSEFRHSFSMKYDRETGKSKVIHPELVKCRIINDFHHANDAYLNIVVGNTYDVKFTQNPYNYIKEYRKNQRDQDNHQEGVERYHMDKVFGYDVKRGNEIAWVAKGDNKSLETVLSVMRKNTPLVTRMNYEAHGALSNQTIWNAEKARNGIGYIGVKNSDPKLSPEKYGGYSTLTTTYFFLVEHTKKGKRIRTIEALPLYLKDKLNTKEKLEKWCSDKDGLGLIEPSVRLEKIKLYSRIQIDGFDLCLTGRAKSNLLTSNDVQVKVDSYWRYYINKLVKLEDEVITIEKNIQLYDLIVDKNINGIFSKRQRPIGDILQLGREKFLALDKENQIETLLKILKVFTFENQGIDLEKIGGTKHSGKMEPNKNITGFDRVLLKNQSITGLFENTVDLLKI